MTTLQHKHRVALVTGAASGIGQQIAHRLAIYDGAKVYVVDRDSEGAARAAALIRSAGGQAAEIVVDLQDPATLAQCMELSVGEFGPPDILVNNAGVVATIPATTFPLDRWNSTMAVNVTAPMVLIQLALKHMLQKKWGRIINIASISGVRAGTGRLAYGTSKAALIALTKQFAIEVAEAGITVNAIAPGPVNTPMVRSLQSSDDQAQYAEMVPMRRYAEPEEIAASVQFLSSEQAAYITGHTLAVDGGFLASGVFLRNLFPQTSATSN